MTEAQRRRRHEHGTKLPMLIRFEDQDQRDRVEVAAGRVAMKIGPFVAAAADMVARCGLNPAAGGPGELGVPGSAYAPYIPRVGSRTRITRAMAAIREAAGEPVAWEPKNPEESSK